MTPLEKFQNLVLDTEIIALSSQNHLRREYIRTNLITKSLLKYLVETCNYSIYHIATKIYQPKGYVVDASTLIDFCNEYGIVTKSVKERANDPIVRKKYVDTCFKKYGTINSLSKGTNSYKKRNKTVKKKYGVTNVFQLESVKTKTKKTLREKYGVDNPINLPSFERNNGRKSKLQLCIENILIKNNIVFESEASNRFSKFNKKLNKFYSPIVDVLINHKKIVIEVNGDLWHGNPKIYKPTDKIKKWGGIITASKIWELDKIRKKQIESFGYKVMVLWESDIRKNIEKIEKTLIKKLLL